MTPQDQESRTAELFHEALARPPDQQSAFLAEACAGNEELFRKLKELLDAYAGVRTSDPAKCAPSRGPLPLAFDPDALIAMGERYDNIQFLGQGGMGVVFRARDREIDKVVALKMLHPSLALNESVVHRFKNEIRLALDITHKNVCRTYGLERFSGTIVISMEYIEGETLRSVLNRVKRVLIPAGLVWAQEISDALAAAHDRKVVHRDLKPENVMIDREGHVKVMDFGIARSIEAAAERTSGTVVGTPRYMSPEQALGRVAGPTSDIYSIGLVLYELFTGIARDPEHPRLPREANPYLPARVDQAIRKCLQDDPRERFQSAHDLSAALAGESVERLRHQEYRRRYVPLAVSGLLGFLVVGALAVNHWKPAVLNTSLISGVPKSTPALPPQPKIERSTSATGLTSARNIGAVAKSASGRPLRPKAGRSSFDSLEGEWSATIADAKGSAAVQFVLLQNSEGDVVGTYTSSLGGGGSMKGKFKDGVLSFEVTQSLTDCPGIFKGAATVAANKAAGSYTGSDCLGDHGKGTLSMTKGLQALAHREAMRSSGIGNYLDARLLLWTEEDARSIIGEPLTHRYVYDDARNVTSDIYTFADPTLAMHHIELGFDPKTKRLTGVFLYPNRATWDDCKKLWGENVTVKVNPDGTKFHTYKDRRLVVYLDRDNNVISLGIHKGLTSLPTQPNDRTAPGPLPPSPGSTLKDGR